MMWQDWMFGVGQFLFALALLPSIYGPRDRKPALATSAWTCVLLILFAATYGTLGLWLGAAAAAVGALAWAVLAWQVIGPDARG